MQTVTAAQRKGGKSQWVWGRLLGVDAARALALIGMMTVHILPGTDPDGTVSTAYLISSGRSSALFAVLAGVGLALANGRGDPPTGRARSAAAAGTAGRAFILGLIGLFLGDLDSGVAAILVNYGFLFLIATLFIGMSARSLGVAAVLWAVLAPPISFWLRMRLPGTSFGVPGFNELGDPIGFLRAIFLTGYYPVFPWTAYLLAGMAAGRLNLGSRRVAAWLLGGGLSLAVGVGLISRLLLDAGGREAMGDLPIQFLGTTPTDTWWYLAVATPHSGTSPDLLHTTGTALAVLGACLLLAAAGRYVLAWLAAAGGMTLSLYTGHVLALTAGWGLEDRPTLILWHVGFAIIFGLLWRKFVGRGPLETLAATFGGFLKSTLIETPPTPKGG